MPDVCPTWIGSLLLCPLRKLVENPDAMLKPFVRPGMTVLEPGPGKGFFTLPLARMVGEAGRVVAMDVQGKMLEGLKKRARKAGLLPRLDCRLVGPDGSAGEDLKDSADFAAAIHVVHEAPDTRAFLGSLQAALKPGAKLLVVEPAGHVTEEKFARMREIAREVGFRELEHGKIPFARRAVFAKA